MIRFSKIPRLAERMNVMIFLGNFNDTAQLLMPVGVGARVGGHSTAVGGTGWAASCGGAHTLPLLSSATQCHHRRLHVPQVLQQTAQHPRGEGCKAAAPWGDVWPGRVHVGGADLPHAS